MARNEGEGWPTAGASWCHGVNFGEGAAKGFMP
jgi:hypothetical protein